MGKQKLYDKLCMKGEKYRCTGSTRKQSTQYGSMQDKDTNTQDRDSITSSSDSITHTYTRTRTHSHTHTHTNTHTHTHTHTHINTHTHTRTHTRTCHLRNSRPAKPQTTSAISRQHTSVAVLNGSMSGLTGTWSVGGVLVHCCYTVATLLLRCLCGRCRV
jgi:hypothetical protein